jgi:hypothetical protein
MASKGAVEGRVHAVDLDGAVREQPRAIVVPEGDVEFRRSHDNLGANMQKRLFCTMTVILALACSACGHSPSLYPVNGKVTVNGTPAAGASIIFQRQGADLMNEQTIMGIVRDDGTFSLVSGRYGEGAPPGEYDVFVEWRHRSERAKGPRGTDRLKGYYADRTHPRLHALVKAEATDLPPFDLTEVTVTQADLKEPEPGHRMPPGRKKTRHLHQWEAGR